MNDDARTRALMRQIETGQLSGAQREALADLVGVIGEAERNRGGLTARDDVSDRTDMSTDIDRTTRVDAACWWATLRGYQHLLDVTDPPLSTPPER